jgi:hypothetical protein
MVRLLGPSQIRHHPRLLLLRRPHPHLARAAAKPMAAHLRVHPAHRLRQPDRLVAARARLPPRSCQLRRLCQRAQLREQLLPAHHLPCAWHGRQRRLLESSPCSWPAHQRCPFRPAASSSAPFRDRWLRQPRQALVSQRDYRFVRQHLHSSWTH